MPRKAVLPTAAPVHEGAATPLRTEVEAAVTVATKVSVEPSGRLNVKVWPPARASASL
jgi:hypothetical protein